MRFVLIHGGCQGAWAWQRVIPEFRVLGHKAVAIDLPGHGARCGETSSVQGYKDAVAKCIEAGDVLVGHSMGGHVASLAADVCPDRVRHIVYLAAGVPLEGKTLSDAMAPAKEEEGGQLVSEEFQSHIRVDQERGTFFVPSLEDAIAVFFHDCDADTAKWGYDQLTPQQLAPLFEPVRLPNFWHADISRSYIMCTEDRSLPKSKSLEFCARLNVKPFIIEGASHSPFLSRPRETAELIVSASETNPMGPINSGRA